MIKMVPGMLLRDIKNFRKLCLSKLAGSCVGMNREIWQIADLKINDSAILKKPFSSEGAESWNNWK